MAETLSQVDFLVEFPEFEEAGAAMIASRLDQAHRAFSADVLGARYLDAVRYKAADLLASSPFGKNLRLAKGDGPTIYREQLDSILSAAPARGIVIHAAPWRVIP